MTMADDYAYEFLRTLFVLRDYLPNIVLIGGCVPYIYSKYMYEAQLPPVYTTDLDILTMNEVPVSDESIRTLLTGAGYDGLVLSIDQTQYYKFESSSVPGFEVEFLTPEPGREHEETIVVQSGLRAQILPGLELLLAHNTVTRIRDKMDEVAVDLEVRVPTPGAFVMNKIRSYLFPIGDAYRIKDIYYVFYLLRYLPIGKQAIVDSIRACASTDDIEALISSVQHLFFDDYSPGVLEVAVQLTGLDMTEENKRLLVLSEFEEFFSLFSH